MTDPHPYAPGPPPYNPVKREPVLVSVALAVVIQIVARSRDWPVSEEDAALIADALSFALFALVRWLVMPVATVKAAGLSPDAVLERAADPAVPPFRGG